MDDDDVVIPWNASDNEQSYNRLHQYVEWQEPYKQEFIL